MPGQLKPPLVALLIAPGEETREAILSGRKHVTVREGHRDYQPDRPVMLCCQIEPWAVMADITEVRHCLLREVTDEEWRADGYLGIQGLGRMVRMMREFYPNIGPDSPVTVIKWTKVRGKLVDGWVERTWGSGRRG